jgi:hypothetical protein
MLHVIESGRYRNIFFLKDQNLPVYKSCQTKPVTARHIQTHRKTEGCCDFQGQAIIIYSLDNVYDMTIGTNISYIKNKEINNTQIYIQQNKNLKL